MHGIAAWFLGSFIHVRVNGNKHTRKQEQVNPISKRWTQYQQQNSKEEQTFSLDYTSITIECEIPTTACTTVQQHSK